MKCTHCGSNLVKKMVLQDKKSKIPLRKRAIVEAVNDQLKNISRIKYRNAGNFLIDLYLVFNCSSLIRKNFLLKCDCLF
ncbi:hypothetical protein PRO82_000789 [Candidatus Protochlamydia amoebophila]|nr:hypothetical protein [Candidatus Protochlamydia amoebophila]